MRFNVSRPLFKALESLLVEKGMVDPRTIDRWIDVYTEEIGPKRGATVVARAWTDPPFKKRLLEDGGGVSAVERRAGEILGAAGDPRRGGHGIVVR